MRFLLAALLFTAACVPKPEEIKGCGAGSEFSQGLQSCVSSAANVSQGSTLSDLTVLEDTPLSFSLPTATTDSVEGGLFWFISSAPKKGLITDCADRAADGSASGTGTVLRSCVYTPDANETGEDSFSYRICGNKEGTKRCTSAFEVDVTIDDDGIDLPTLNAPTAVVINEGQTFNFDTRVSKVTLGEDDDFYLCVDLLDPDAALGAPAATNVNHPLDPIALNDVVCSRLGDEADDLSAVMATFSATALALPTTTGKTAHIMMRLCESPVPTNCAVAGIDGVDNDADTLVDEEDEWDPTDLLTVSVRRVEVTVSNINFVPVMSGLSQTLASITEGDPALSISTDAGATPDRVLVNTATDADGDVLNYEIIPTSFFPTFSGTLSCTPGTQLNCIFTPDPDYSGAISFRYLARDPQNASSGVVTVTMNVTPVNDAPIFVANAATSQVYGYSLVPVALQENVTLLNRTLKVGEGGGSTENNQILTLLAVSSDPTLLDASDITIRRGSLAIGALSATVPKAIEPTATDADAQNYTLSFKPKPGVVSDTPFQVTLTLSDGTLNDTLVFDFNGITNVDDAPSFSLAPPSSFGIKLGAISKDLVFRATPGANDWDDVTNGGQKLKVRLNSSNVSVLNLTGSNLASGAGITVTKGVGADCVASSCLYTLEYDGSNDPSDDDIVLSLPPGVRGNSTLSIVLQDDVSSTTVTQSVVVRVLDFAFAFNGWDSITAAGRRTGHTGTAIAPSSFGLSWNALTVTEGGAITNAYTVRVYRKSTNDFSTLPANALLNAGGASSKLNAGFTGSTVFDDSTTLASGERFYVSLAIVPTLLGEPIQAVGSSDSVLEIVIPPDNMVLLHRWMSNIVHCAQVQKTADRNNNYRCLNSGLTGTLDGGNWYFDQGHHLIVDAYESGCPYTAGHIEDLRSQSPAGLAGTVHYERDTGACTYSDGTGTGPGDWLPFGAAALVLNPTLSIAQPELPPLVQLTRSEAQATCEADLPKCEGAACPVLWSGVDRELPTRAEYVKFSRWASFVAPLTIDDVENSGNHTSAVRGCNTNSAFGVPFKALGSITSFLDNSLPSSLASGNKTMLNSASASSNCLSIYGISNFVGNVGEWLADSFSCSEIDSTTASCQATTAAGTAGLTPVNQNQYGVTYAFDGSVRNGPLLSKDAPVEFNTLMVAGVDRLHLVSFLPFKEDVTIPFPAIGLPRFSTGALPNFTGTVTAYTDTATLHWSGDTAGAGTEYAFVSGGNYTMGVGAGRYTVELRQDNDSDVKVGSRCVMRLAPSP